MNPERVHPWRLTVKAKLCSSQRGAGGEGTEAGVRSSRVCMSSGSKMLIPAWRAQRLGFHQFLSEEEIGN